MAIGKKTGGRDWQKGQSGHISKLPAELKDKPYLSKQMFKYLLNKYAGMTVKELKEVYTDPNTPCLDLWICTVMVKGIEQGDMQRFGFLLDRMIGKVKEMVEVEVKPIVEFETNIQADGTLLQDVIKGEILDARERNSETNSTFEFA